MPSRALTRRDPPQGKKGFSKSKGFTLVELMIALAVLAIITSLALPSYRTILEKRQVTSAANQLSAFLTNVQLESVKRSENLFVDYNRTDSDTWCVGVTNTDSCDCTKAITDAASCDIEGELRVFSNANLNHPKMMASMSGNGDFEFDYGRGIMTDVTDGATFGLLSEDGSYALNVSIDVTGRVKTCTDASKAVPGFGECP
jgi:type IV fimbrial biogenesis protein FimT